ncbi:prolyl oligopeptidase [Meira miltonrushii]|uniref:Prolyl endopeptidase n=1 Tax=Meira miltonrushii TaxID=1280837 RepID=A0A316V703_9BASI|nr:prolyl oligopeptidase [Meira miltonrushii]PWN33212.1 prolyl oligopeptidase [Meira miltonrushii]
MPERIGDTYEKNGGRNSRKAFCSVATFAYILAGETCFITTRATIISMHLEPNIIAMQLLLTVSAFLMVLSASVANAEAQEKAVKAGLTYPKVHRVTKMWSYRSAKAKGNVTYSDPYFWLEGSSKDKSIQQFITDQSKVTEDYVQGCRNKGAIIESLTAASNYDSYGSVSLVSSNTGGSSFYIFSLSRSGNQPPVWYTASVAEFQAAKRENFATPPGEPFLDEALLSTDGSARILYTRVSPNGKIFSYLVIGAGEVGDWYFRYFDSILINKSKAFLAGGQDLGYKIRYHVWGTNSSRDITVFDSKNAGEYGSVSYYYTHVSVDGRWLIVSGYHDASNNNVAVYATLLIGQTVSENMKWISLAPSYDYSLLPAGIINDTYYVSTNRDAPNSKVAKIKLDWSKARQVKKFTELQDRSEMIDVIPERKDALIIFNGKLIRRLVPKEMVTIADVSGDQRSDTFILSFYSWNSPQKIYEFKWTKKDVQTSQVTIQHVKGSDPNDFMIEQRYATSKDVIMGISFGLRHGDKGGKWHDTAKGLKKQKTFDDVLAILEDLVKLKITSPGNIILEGGSAGRTAVGAIINQAPSGLIGVALIVRAMTDVFQLELRSTLGNANIAEFGDVTTPEGFDAVRAWSPL